MVPYFGRKSALAESAANSSPSDDRHDRSRLERYRVELEQSLRIRYARALIPLQGGGTLLTPGAQYPNAPYGGYFPDDCAWPLIGLPDLGDREQLRRQLEFITECAVGLDVVPDHLYADGTPMMRPGPDEGPGLGSGMPLHLPAAWIRLLDVQEQQGITIPRKAEWAALIERSLARVPFAQGLAYADPQDPPVGYGFEDTIRLSGFELMSSLMLLRGFERAAALFKNELSEARLAECRRRAQALRGGLGRLWDDAAGGYLAASEAGHQVSVWGSGLAGSIASPPIASRIAAAFRVRRTCGGDAPAKRYDPGR
jgi:hypothetical protein